MLYFLTENFRLGLKNLYLHKLRTMLTALGIIFGVAAVIIMVAIGEGAKREAIKQMQRLGANNIQIKSVKPPESTSGVASRLLEYGITETDFTRICNIPGLEKIVPLKDTKKPVVRNAKTFPALSAVATTSDLFPVINLRVDEGKLFTQLQEEQSAPVCVIGSEAARQLFPSEDPLGQTVQIGTPNLGQVVVTVIGVLEPTGLRASGDKSGGMARDVDSDVYFPLPLSKKLFGSLSVRRLSGSFERESVVYTELWARANDINDVERTSGVFSYALGLPGRVDVQVKAPIEILRTAEQQARTFNMLMGGIAAISLIVGGIGIMNIMLASVTERTREIGIRRALGAKQKHITLQFLIETTAISLSGGLLGVISGVGTALLIPILLSLFNVNDYHTAIAPWSVLSSFIISGMIGIIFGIYPAITAAGMNPIEALRHE